MLLAYEATKDLLVTTRITQTPFESFAAPVLEGQKPVILPILCAGIGVVDGSLQLMPAARVACRGLYRDEETLKPKRT